MEAFARYALLEVLYLLFQDQHKQIGRVSDLRSPLCKSLSGLLSNSEDLRS